MASFSSELIQLCEKLYKIFFVFLVPKITKPLQDLSVNEKAAAIFECHVDDEQVLDIEWYRNDERIYVCVFDFTETWLHFRVISLRSASGQGG